MGDKKELKGFFEVIVRYLIVVVLGLGNLSLFYVVLKPLTLWGVSSLLGLFSDVVVLTNGFVYDGVFFELVSACVGGSAFYLLFIFIMSSRDIVWLRRLKMIVFAFLLLYVFNVLRIVFMAVFVDSVYFDVFHLGIWYFVSTVFVVLIWFLMVWLFGVKSIPVYSDFKFIVGLLKKSYGVRRKGGGKRVRRKGGGKRAGVKIRGR
jgi:exosortase/archaeosortase family protein